MNKVDEMLAAASTVEEYSKSYFEHLAELFAKINLSEIKKVVDIFHDCYQKNKKIIFIGNGGSASTASHFALDFSKWTLLDGRKPVKAVSLTDSVAHITALGNDVGYEYIFVAQLKNQYEEGDVLVGISASGNSPNLVKAFDYVNSMGGTTIALVGFDGGKLKEIATESVHIPSDKGEYGPIEDIHLTLDHLIVTYFKKLLSQPN